MNSDLLVEGVLRSVMGGGRKRSRRALRYLTHGHGSMWTHPTTLLTAAGLAWGVYETMTNKTPDGIQWGGGSSPGPAGDPVPASPVPAAPLPPLPDVAAPGGAAIGDDALRLIRLAISAANADGLMNEHERAAVMQQAQAAGVVDIVEQELEQRRPLAQIVAGVSDPAQRATLYVLAFTVLRADEQLSGAERIYLAQLAHLLGFDPETVQRLEKDTGERIDALGDQGQLGG
jgi:uncharacterized membrane protein YebE (DUF533 family)